MSPNDTIQAVNRCLDVLEVIALAQTPLGVSELARRVSLSKATAHRLCQTLVHKDFLHQDETTGRYQPGIKLYELAGRLLAGMDFVRLVRPFLNRLSMEFGENTFAAMLVGNREIFICDEVRLDHGVRPASLLGLRSALPVAPGGLICLSRLNQDQVEGAVEFAADTKAISDDHQEQILAHVYALRSQQYCVQPDVPFDGASVISSAIIGRGGAVLGAVGFCCPSFRLDASRCVALGKACWRTAMAMSGVFGWDGSEPTST